MGILKDRRYIPQIIEIIRSDKNLRVLRSALIAFSRETDITITADEEGAKTALAWWEQHKSEFK